MQKSFTINYMLENCGCYSHAKLADCSFMKNTSAITLESIITSEIPLKDKYWFVCKKLLTKKENQTVAIDLAEIVLPIYEKRYPTDNRPKEAIEAAKLFISGHITVDELLLKRSAADDAAAYAAADAAAYAAAAAAAAYAAAADDDAADDAAAAAADAADDAAAAAADDAADDAAAYAAAAADDDAAAYAAAYAYKKEIFNYLVKLTT